jgi:serine protease Do
MKIKNPKVYGLKAVEFEDSNKLSEGEWVLAIGNPYGLSRTITSGIVSSKGRDNIGFTDIEDFIQCDVPINPGNSGGPLINLRGRLVGINTAIRSESGGFQGISFSIPSNMVKRVCRELIAHGRVRRGWIGFLAKEKRPRSSYGGNYLKIISIIRNSPAESAGLKSGDIIREVDGEKITTLGGLIKSVGNKTVGSTIGITLARNGALKHVSLVLRERTVYDKIKKGMNLLFNLYGIEIDENAENGEVVISYLSPKSIPYNLKKGDVVVSINDSGVSSLDSFVRTFDKDGHRIKKMKVNRDTRILDVHFTND